MRTRRKVFSSEADFQLALAWTIKDVYRDSVDVRMEYCPDFDLNMHIDIVVFVGDKWIPIELKYKTTHVHGGIKVTEVWMAEVNAVRYAIPNSRPERPLLAYSCGNNRCCIYSLVKRIFIRFDNWDKEKHSR